MLQSVSDSARIADVLDLVQSRGLQVSAVIVGDVRLVLATPWPAPAPTQASEVRKDRGADPKLEALRAKGLKEFGRRMPDEFLRSLEPVL